MMRSIFSYSLIALLFLSATAQAQQTTIHSPYQRNSHSFSENIGVQWGVRAPGWFFNFGGPPPPAAAGAARFGTGFHAGNARGYFNAYAGQSSNTNLSSGTSSLTLGNGQSGSLFEGRQVPFVLGVVPVVGDFAGGPFVPGMSAPQVSPIQQRVDRLRAEGKSLTEERPAEQPIQAAAPVQLPNVPAGSVESLAEARAAQQSAQAAADTNEANDYLARANLALAANKFGLARVYLQMALRRATGERRQQIEQRLRSPTLSASSAAP